MTDQQKPTTTDAGIPVASDEHSLTAGPNGPIAMGDHYLLEQMQRFNREMIPDRQPHAKGSGAFGRFEVTHDVSAYTRAAFLQPGTTTEMAARFSTVAGEAGSPDTWRDPRGFALKFYTHRIGTNYQQIPVNRPKSEVNSYSQRGAMRVVDAQDPVYAPNSKGGPAADGERYPEPQGWEADGVLVRAAYVPHEEDDDFVQANTLVTEVMDDAQRERLVSNASGHLLDGVSEEVLERAFAYWRSIDKGIGDRIEEAVRAEAG